MACEMTRQMMGWHVKEVFYFKVLTTNLATIQIKMFVLRRMVSWWHILLNSKWANVNFGFPVIIAEPC